MSKIVVNVRLLSGDILPVSVRARGGVAKYVTVRPALEKAVLDHVEHKSSEYCVRFIHEDDEERRAAIKREHTNAMFRRNDKRDATEEEHVMWNSFTPTMELAEALNKKLINSRTYHDGDSVTAWVEEAFVPSASDWADGDSE